MSKQDRQGVRNARDLEQKYKLGETNKASKNASQQREMLARVEQAVAQFVATMTSDFNTLQEKVAKLEGNLGLDILSIYPVGSVYTTIATDKPSDLFGGTWELIAEGNIIVGNTVVEEDSGSEQLELFQGNDKCFVWKRTA